MGRILGIDLGHRYIGVAVSDEMKFIAQGFRTIQRNDHYEWLHKIRGMIEQKDIEKIVVGYPINMDGDIGSSAQEVQEVAAKLKEETGLPVILWDERLSTVQAEKVLLDANVKRKKRRKVIDQMAAVIILQAYLDSLHH